MGVEENENCYRKGVIGGFGTLVGIKDQKSFLIGTWKQGLRLMENGVELYSGKLPGDRQLRDILYNPHFNCYFLALNKKLYKKEIDNKPPYVFMDVDCGWRYGAYLRYSKQQQRLIVNKDERNVKMKKSVGNEIMDFRVSGENQEKVVAVTKDGFVLLYSLDGQRRGMVHSYEIELIDERDEECRSIAVCEKGENVLVETKGWNWGCSRMLLFQLANDTFTNTTSIDLFDQGIGCKFALDCYGYAGSHVLCVGWIIFFSGQECTSTAI